MPVYPTPGPAPKPASKRRRRNTPRSYGAAKPTTAPAAHVQDRVLGFDAHPLVVDMWATIRESAESKFYSHADWERVRWELWYANTAMRSPRLSGQSWAQIQHGLNDLLISPAAKRRAAIELKPPGPDTDEITAVSMMSEYKAKLKPV
jgi:hypothetical protein